MKSWNIVFVSYEALCRLHHAIWHDMFRKKIPNLPAVSNLIQNINCNINDLVNMPSLNTDDAYLKTFSTTNYAPLYSSQKLIHVSNIIQTVLYIDSVYRLCPCVSHDQTWSQTATLTLQRAPLSPTAPPSISLSFPPSARLLAPFPPAAVLGGHSPSWATSCCCLTPPPVPANTTGKLISAR